MSELRTPDQILADVGINVENFKKEKELLYNCIRMAMDDFAEQYHNWKISRANGVDKSTEPALHKHIVSNSLFPCGFEKCLVDIDGKKMCSFCKYNSNDW